MGGEIRARGAQRRNYKSSAGTSRGLRATLHVQNRTRNTGTRNGETGDG